MLNLKERIAIIGGSGFIGRHLVEAFKREFIVRIIDVKEPDIKDPKNVEYVKIDIRNRNDLESALRGVDLVIHTAIIQIPRINEEPRLAYEVNFKGTMNVCEIVEELKDVRGLILTSSWHVYGEKIDFEIREDVGYFPDRVSPRAFRYTLSKIAQEAIVRYFHELGNKYYGIIRLATVLGEGMPEKTAANIFIERGIKGQAITPFKDSMHRPMLYVDIMDVKKAIYNYAVEIIDSKIPHGRSIDHIYNLMHPEPITILELAHLIKSLIVEISKGKINPPVEIIDRGVPALFSAEDKHKIKVNVEKTIKELGIEKLIHPKETLRRLIAKRYSEIYGAS